MLGPRGRLRRLQAGGHKAAADIADRVPMTAQGPGHGVIIEGVALLTLQELQNPGSRLCAGRSPAQPDIDP
jgi:hypothetical protein